MVKYYHVVWSVPNYPTLKKKMFLAGAFQVNTEALTDEIIFKNLTERQ